MRRWAALLLAAGAGYFGVHAWAVAAGVAGLCFADRGALIDSVVESMGSWLLIGTAGAVLCVLALRYDRLGTETQRGILLCCAIAGSAAGVVEWWSSMYFLAPAAFLAIA